MNCMYAKKENKKSNFMQRHNPTTVQRNNVELCVFFFHLHPHLSLRSPHSFTPTGVHITSNRNVKRLTVAGQKRRRGGVCPKRDSSGSMGPEAVFTLLLV